MCDTTSLEFRTFVTSQHNRSRAAADFLSATDVSSAMSPSVPSVLNTGRPVSMKSEGKSGRFETEKSTESSSFRGGYREVRAHNDCRDVVKPEPVQNCRLPQPSQGKLN